jgi:heme oxygenase-like protein
VSTLDASPGLGTRLIVLPEPRGPLSERLCAALLEEPGTAIALPETPSSDPLADDDLHLALYIAYELHYTAVAGVEDAWEWSPSLLAFRQALEQQFESAVRALLDDDQPVDADEVGDTLQQLVAEDDGPPLSRFAETQATREQMLEHVVHRSAYQLKEADPHSWAIPRLAGPPKAALVEVQFDEYGEGRAERVHAELFAETMRALGLDPGYGAYLDWLPGITLATVNLMSLFGLNRRLVGAIVGHLAAFEMTSSIPNRRYGNAFRRLGCGTEVTRFYDEHVEADAVHESIAAWDLAGALAKGDPATAEQIVFGARALLALEARWAAHLLASWSAGRSSLLRPLPQS